MLSKKLIFIALGLGLALGFAASRIRVIELGYAVTRLEKEIEKLKQEKGLLKTRLANALSTQKLAESAKRHKMEPPDKTKIIFMAEEIQ